MAHGNKERRKLWFVERAHAGREGAGNRAPACVGRAIMEDAEGALPLLSLAVKGRGLRGRLWERRIRNPGLGGHCTSGILERSCKHRLVFTRLFFGNDVVVGVDTSEEAGVRHRDEQNCSKYDRKSWSWRHHGRGTCFIDDKETGEGARCWEDKCAVASLIKAVMGGYGDEKLQSLCWKSTSSSADIKFFAPPYYLYRQIKQRAIEKKEENCCNYFPFTAMHSYMNSHSQKA